jgi:hypothetical protein
MKIEVLDPSAGRDLGGRRRSGQMVSIPNLPLAATMPFVRVRRVAPGEAPGSYKIVVHVLPLEAGAEIEPDDSDAQANELPLPARRSLPRLAARPGLLPLSTAALAEGACCAADLDPIPNVSSRSRSSDAAGKKLSEARGRRGRARRAAQRAWCPPGPPSCS